MQRRTSRLTTWASSNQHSPELLVFQARSSLRTADTRQALYIHITDTFLWSQKFATFAPPNLEARHCSRRRKRRAKTRRIWPPANGSFQRMGQPSSCEAAIAGCPILNFAFFAKFRVGIFAGSSAYSCP